MSFEKQSKLQDRYSSAEAVVNRDRKKSLLSEIERLDKQYYLIAHPTLTSGFTSIDRIHKSIKRNIFISDGLSYLRKRLDKIYLTEKQPINWQHIKNKIILTSYTIHLTIILNLCIFYKTYTTQELKKLATEETTSQKK